MQRAQLSLTSGNDTSLFSTQINSLALQRNQKEEARASRDTALITRIGSLEEKIQSILQANRQIESQLNTACALYEQRQQDHEQSKLPQEKEIVLLQEQLLQLNTAIAALSQTNLDLANQVDPKTRERDHWRVEYDKIPPWNRYNY